MSCWTHIVASLDIDTFTEDKNLTTIVKNKLEKAPKITGSEQDAQIFVNLLQYYNVSTYDKDGNIIEFQTRVVIIIVGDLRDKDKKETEREYNKFKKFLINCGYYIRNESVNIIEGSLRTLVT